MKIYHFLILFLTSPLLLCSVVSSLETFQQKIVVNCSELSILPITPNLFKWDPQQGYVNQIGYISKLANSPDLPGWLTYTYDGTNSIGYLYGVPPTPTTSQQSSYSINLEIIGFNRAQSYETRKLMISMEILKKDVKPYVMELKIDNLNVKEMATPRRMGDLLSIVSNQLAWTMGDGREVIPVFLASAVVLGENRVPVRPTDAEGVVIHFASDTDFSPELKKLQSEVLPLWKLRPCPRDLKRTSVERFFRKYNFLVDWCAFQLSNATETSVEEQEVIPRESINNDDITIGMERERHSSSISGEQEIFNFRSEVPERDYSFEILVSTIIPGSIGGLVGFVLIILLRTDRDEETEVDDDGLFFEAAFRTLYAILRIKKRYNTNGNGVQRGQSQYIYHQASTEGDVGGIVIMTRDDGFTAPSVDDESDIQRTPVPPQYAETHPNGAPALIYAV